MLRTPPSQPTFQLAPASHLQTPDGRAPKVNKHDAKNNPAPDYRFSIGDKVVLLTPGGRAVGTYTIKERKLNEASHDLYIVKNKDGVHASWVGRTDLSRARS